MQASQAGSEFTRLATYADNLATISATADHGENCKTDRSMPKKANSSLLDLKEGCVRAAHEVIAERGIENLSLRDVARKLGVSHQAPYKHFPSRDHLLAEIMRRCFAGFAEALDTRQQFEDAAQDLGSLGLAYLAYAAAHPLEYRLMFGTPWPDPKTHSAMVERAVYAFNTLRTALSRLKGHQADLLTIELDAMFIWSALHGVASIRQANVINQLELHEKVNAGACEHVLEMISRALSNSNARNN